MALIAFGATGEQGQADRQDVREGDAVEQVEHDGQNRPIFSPSPCVAEAMTRQRPAGNAEQAADHQLAELVRLAPFPAPQAPEDPATAIKHQTLVMVSSVISQLVGSRVPKKTRSNCASPQTR